jgi:hypothetical protein
MSTPFSLHISSTFGFATPLRLEGNQPVLSTEVNDLSCSSRETEQTLCPDQIYDFTECEKCSMIERFLDVSIVTISDSMDQVVFIFELRF